MVYPMNADVYPLFGKVCSNHPFSGANLLLVSGRVKATTPSFPVLT